MEFRVIDQQQWGRREYFEHYTAAVPCTYSMCVRLDITALVKAEVKLYPAMLYALTTIVNRHEEFRTAYNPQGQVGVFSQMMPCYTVFHRDSELFSNLWTEFSPNYTQFLHAYQQDLAAYGQVQRMEAKPGTPANTFPVSMIPWTTFEGFHLHLQKGYEYLLPIFTMGQYQSEGGRYWLPLSVQVHHGVCDGFHVCRFIRELQELVEDEQAFAVTPQNIQ